jgi:hypothetical protein
MTCSDYAAATKSRRFDVAIDVGDDLDRQIFSAQARLLPAASVASITFIQVRWRGCIKAALH